MAVAGIGERRGKNVSEESGWLSTNSTIPRHASRRRAAGGEGVREDGSARPRAADEAQHVPAEIVHGGAVAAGVSAGCWPAEALQSASGREAGCSGAVLHSERRALGSGGDGLPSARSRTPCLGSRFRILGRSGGGAAFAMLGLLVLGLLTELDAGNLDQLEPLWAAGSNVKGELASTVNILTSTPNYQPVQIMGFDVVGLGKDVVSVTGGYSHGFAVVRNISLPESEGSNTWGWGDNTHGQLGPADAGSTGAAPRELHRSLFPKVAEGNEITAARRAFSYSNWTAAGYTTFARQLTLGVKSLAMLEDEVNGIIGAGQVLALSADCPSGKVLVAIVKPGFQLNLPTGLAERLGHSPKLLPPTGLLNEVSARLGNNQFVYRNWTRISSRFPISVSYRAWSESLATATTHTLTLPAAFPPYDPWSPSTLASALNSKASANGHETDLFDFGGAGLAWGDMATATVKHVGYTLLLDHAKDQLGFMSQVPAANEFSGDVPNEVSPHAQNNEFTYSFSSGSDIVNHTISLTTGIWSLASLTAEIDAGLSAEGHAGAFRVSTDTDGYVAFEVRLEGYQARFSNTVSVGRYLGLPQRDFPCRPGTDVACSGAEAGDAQGLSTASKRYQTRSTNKRPLAPTFAASGTCTGTCYCAETPGDSTPLCLEAGSGIAAPTGNARDASGCSCAARGEALLQRNATVQWGRLLTFTAPLPDGVYTLASLNTAIEQGLAANKHSTSAFYFLQEPGGEARLQLTVLPASFQVDFTSGGIRDLLGFSPGRYPSYLTGDFTTHVNFYSVSSTIVSTLLTGKYSMLADDVGERVIKVAAGGGHSLVLTYDDVWDRTRVWAFGDNSFGQLGSSGFAASNPVPVLVGAAGNFDPLKAEDVYAGGFHSAVVDSSKRAWLFGHNAHSQLGFTCAGTCVDACPSTPDSPCLTQPVPTRLPSSVPTGSWLNVSMALGLHHSLLLQPALDGNSSRFFSFGRNTYGQLARGDASVVGEPRTASNTTFLALCAGADHTMLLDADGRLWSAGRNHVGQLGSRFKDGAQFDNAPHVDLTLVGTQLDGDADNLALKYENPFGGDSVEKFGCGSQHSLATSGGRGFGFGSNRYGQLISEFNVGTGNANPIPLEIDLSLLREDPNDPRSQPMLEAWAFGDISLVRTERAPCLIGHYSRDGLQPCLPCPPGNYSTTQGVTSCTPCPTGNYSEGGAFICSQCRIGTYTHEVGMSECEQCPADKPGTFRLGSTSIDDCTAFCQAGTFGASLGTPPCKPCTPGTFSNDEAFIACEPCPIGTYEPGNGSKSCIPCDGLNSTAQTGQINSSSCLEICAAGSSGPDGLEACTLCPAGTSAPSPRTAECTPCAQNTYQDTTGQETCSSCPSGEGTLGEGSDSFSACVVLCAPGRASAAGVVPCEPCRAGFFALEPGTRACSACATGSFSAPAANNCTTCDAGTFAAAENSSSCEPCPLGSFQQLPGQSGCALCPISTFANATGSTFCHPCPSGLNTKDQGSDSESLCAELCDPGYSSDDGLVPDGGSCTPCPAGTASVSPNPTGFGASTCADCAPRSFSSGAAAACSLCAPGSFSNTSLTVTCFLCDPGAFSPGNATSCALCLPGSFSNASGVGACDPCAEGSYGGSFGATGCTPCGNGTHSPTPGRTAPCDDCTAGKFAAAEGLPECDPCSPGSSSTPGADACSPCPLGTFSAAPGASECQLCLVGTFSNDTGLAGCYECSPGTAAPKGAESCGECVKGRYSDGTLAACTACGVGYDTRGNASSLLADCRRICTKGTYGEFGLSSSTASPCAFCAPGSEAPGNYTESCSECLSGTFSRGRGLDAECQNCPAGSFSGGNASLCVDCAPGTYAADDGAAACDACAAGAFMGEEGRDACALCPLGTYSTPARIECASCGTDTSTGSPGARTFEECQAYCPVGEFGTDNGVNTSTPCQKCAPGTYSPFTKQSVCLDCPPGAFSEMEGASTCTLCPVHTFNDMDGALECLTCPASKRTEAGVSTYEPTYTLQPGAPLESDCRQYAGYACDSNPRALSVYPLYVGGDNEYGQAFEGNIAQGANGLSIKQSIPACTLFAGAEIAQSKSGVHHSVVQTAVVTNATRSNASTSNSVEFDTALWAFGLNLYGQLGSRRGLGTDQANPTPGLIPRYLFPSTAAGNLIAPSASNNLFQYRTWSDEAGANVVYNISIPEGVYGPSDVLALVDTEMARLYGHPQGVFALVIDDRMQLANLLVAKPGFQADFTLSGATLRDKFGLAAERIPQAGSVNEVSAAAGNNIFRYRYYCSGASCSSSRTVSVAIPDGIYTLDRLEAAIQQATFSNGDTRSLFGFLMAGQRVNITITFTGFQVVSDSDTVASLLGFTENLPAAGPVTEIDAQVGLYIGQGQQDRPYLNEETSPFFAPYRAAGAASGEMSADFVLGEHHTLIKTWDAERTRSRLWALGSNVYGQLGVSHNAGTTGTTHVPIPVPVFDEATGGREAVAIQVGAQHTVIQDKEGNLWMFGNNRFGQLGRPDNAGTLQESWVPTLFNATYVGGVYNDSSEVRIADVTVGYYHTLLRTLDRLGEARLWAFGSNEFGQLGHTVRVGKCIDPANPSLTRSCKALIEEEKEAIPVENWEPRELPTLELFGGYGVEIMKAGGEHTVVLATDQRTYCFGSNQFGQCGYEPNAFSNFQQYPLPNPTPLPLGTIKDNTLASLFITPPVLCCGMAANVSALPDGCSGDKSTWMANGEEIKCPFNHSRVRALSLGAGHTLVRTSDRKIYSFGSDSSGQLMRGTGNIGIDNANPDISEVALVNFGYGNQPLVDFAAGGDQSFIQTHRVYCRPGNHSVDRRVPCNRCESGSFSPDVGTLTGRRFSFDQSVRQRYMTLQTIEYLPISTYFSCEPCAAGTFSAKEAKECGDCDAGTYSFWGASTCHECLPGTFSNDSRAGNCTLCSPGTYSEDGASYCPPCAPGSYTDEVAQGVCTFCELGKYQPENGTTTCIPCPIDTYQNDTGQTGCVTCPDGRRTDDIGLYHPWRCSEICDRGEVGEPLVPGGKSVRPCTPCTPGFYANERGFTACLPCRAGYYTDQNATYDCGACPAGTFSTGAATACTSCAAGKFASQNASVCGRCAAGSTSGPGAAVCTKCNPGYFEPESGTRLSCTPCAIGSFSDAGAPLCTPCLPGSFTDTIATPNCSLCSGGTYAPTPGRTVCLNCSAGLFSPDGAVDCSTCPEGTFSGSIGSAACLPCAPGLFSLGNQSSCTPCQLGTQASSPGTVNCSLCRGGYFANVTGLPECYPCAGGTFVNTTGSSVCDDCFQGTVSTQNATVCELCIPGTFAAVSRMTSCDLCAVGDFTEAFKAVACIDCPQGTTTRGKNARLKLPSDGAARVDGNGLPFLVPDWFNDEIDDCLDECRAGTYSIWGVPPCVPCPAGRFSFANGSTECSPCPSGFSSASGATVCTQCLAGSFALAGSSSCTLCAAGQFQPSPGQAACELCAMDTFKQATGALVCDVCPLRVQSTEDTFYYKDCRTACAADEANITASTVNASCCFHAPVQSVSIPNSAADNLETIVQLINDAVFARALVFNLLRVEPDLEGWSRGITASRLFTVYIQYGGFQASFGQTSVTNNVGRILGFNVDVPPGRPALCYSASDSLVSSGGCYSSESFVAPELPVTLLTRETGTHLRDLCQSFCSPGSANNETNGEDRPSSPCQPCNDGTYQNLVGEPLCFNCVAGRYTAADGLPYKVCDECPRGTFSATVKATSCAFCAVGDFAPFLASTECKTCPAGTFSEANLTAGAPRPNLYPDTCAECPAGAFNTMTGGTGCVNCDPGSYAPFSSSTFCTLCEPGRATNDTKAPFCRVCPPGFKSHREVASLDCDICPGGTFSPRQSSTCSTCPPGSFSLAESESCTLCPPGSVSTSAGATSCDICAAGSFSEGNQSVCLLCAPGAYMDQANASACVKCTEGSFAEGGGRTSCTLCGYNSFAASGAASCERCEDTPVYLSSFFDSIEQAFLGTNTTGTAKTTDRDCRLRCEAGSAGFNGIEPCYICDPGGHSPGMAPGQRPSNTGTPCRVSTENKYTWADTGIVETYIFNGSCAALACPLCAPGTVSKGNANLECEICEANTYSDLGEVNCTACPVGKVTDTFGSGSPDDCQSKCDFGSYSLSGLQPCIKCPLGTFNNGKGVTGCTLCPRAQFMPILGSSYCWDCPAGRGTLEQGSKLVSECLGIAAKPFNATLCTPEGLYRLDEGVIAEVYIRNPGRGNPSFGRLDISSEGGGNFEARFFSDANGSIAKVSIMEGFEGSRYTSQDLVVPVYQNINDPNRRSLTLVEGSVTSVTRRKFSDLIATPATYQFGCSAGIVTAGPAVGGVRVEYLAERGAVSSFCFGTFSGQLCKEDLSTRGAGFTSTPPFTLTDTAAASSCRCGSAVDSITPSSPGAGYLPGRLIASMTLPAECTRFQCGNASTFNATFALLVFNETAPLEGCPAYCVAALRGGVNFSATFDVDGSKCLGNIYNGTLCNGTEVFHATGGISSASIARPGGGFNVSLVSLAPAYGTRTRCDAGDGFPRDDCLQESTITEVRILGAVNVSTHSKDGFQLLSGQGHEGLKGVLRVDCSSLDTTGAGCNGTNCSNATEGGGGTRCVGSGLAGTCTLSSSRDIYSSFDTVTVAISNHGEGYTLDAPPALYCVFFFGNCSTEEEIGRVTNCNVFLRSNLSTSTLSIPANYSRPENYTVSLNADGGALFAPIIPTGGALDLTIGRTGEEGSHDACLRITRAEPVVLEVGALREIESRLFGFPAYLPAFHVESLVLNLFALGSDRLYWLLRAAVATDHLALGDCFCRLNTTALRADPANNATVTRAVECTCRASTPLWGLDIPITFTLFETSTRFDPAGPTSTQVHLALSKASANYTSSWFPLAAGGIPWFQDAPSDSWLHGISFQRGINLAVSVSSLAVSFPWSLSAFGARYERGVTIEVRGATQLPTAEGDFHVQGAERFFPRIRNGSTTFSLVRSHVDIPGCLFPATATHDFTLTFDGPAEFLPLGSVLLAGPAVLAFKGVRDAEDAIFHLPVLITLHDNAPFLLSSRFRSSRLERYLSASTINAAGNTSSTYWPRPFGAGWIRLGVTTVDLTAWTYSVTPGVTIEHLGFEAPATAHMLADPSTLRARVSDVAARVIGSSAARFPHIMAEVSTTVTYSDPAAVVRTMVQEAMTLNLSNPVCATTAGQDLEFASRDARFVFSTWDAEQHKVPSRDARLHNCVTREGTVPVGTPCHFPFQYNGEVFTSCTATDWHRPWCSADAVYSGRWGECVCDRLRRGLSFEGSVAINRGGPMVEISGPTIDALLAPLGGAVNGSLEVFLPWFTSASPNDIQLHVLLTPADPSACLAALAAGDAASVAYPSNTAPPASPHGECERLGYVSQWGGTPGDASSIVCVDPGTLGAAGAGGLGSASTLSQLAGEGGVPATLRSVYTARDLEEVCVEAGLARELSLCAAEKFRNIPVAAPELFGRQFCFWTDTSAIPNAGCCDTARYNKFAECADCFGPSCATKYTPLRAWQLQDTLCFSDPCF